MNEYNRNTSLYVCHCQAARYCFYRINLAANIQNWKHTEKRNGRFNNNNGEFVEVTLRYKQVYRRSKRILCVEKLPNCRQKFSNIPKGKFPTKKYLIYDKSSVFNVLRSTNIPLISNLPFVSLYRILPI